MGEMIRLKITTGKNISTEECKVIDFTNVLDYWNGGMHIVPQAIRNMHLSDYKNNKCLTWYEKQQLHHDQLMTEFKKIFKWQNK
jgi:hypothetical protein